MTPIAVVQALLGKLGLKLTCTGRDVADDGRRGGVRVYQYQPPNDDRDTIFTQWQQRDAIAQTKQAEVEQATVLSTVSTVEIDPPPDISVLKESASGLRTETKRHGSLPQATNDREGEKTASTIRVDSLLTRVQHACTWIVHRSLRV